MNPFNEAQNTSLNPFSAQFCPVEPEVNRISFHLYSTLLVKFSCTTETPDIIRIAQLCYCMKKGAQWFVALANYEPFVEQLRALPLKIEALPSWIYPHILDTTKNSEAISSLLPLSLTKSLLPHQLEGVSITYSRGGRIMIGDEMGLGKTIQAVAIAALYRSEWPLLIVCPASVIEHWREELCKWLEMKPEEVSPTSSVVAILSYESAVKRAEELKQLKFQVVICDESHYMKNSQAKRAQVMLGIVREAKRAILLSGTAILSRPMELYTQISALEPTLLPSSYEFGCRYCSNALGDFKGASNLEELNAFLLNKVMIRRLKEHVLRLPEKTREVMELNVNVTKEVETANGDEVIDEEDQKTIHEATKLEYGAIMTQYRDAGLRKVEPLIQVLNTLLEDPDQKVLIFCHHQAVLNAFQDWLTKENMGYIRIDGGTAPEFRQVLVKQLKPRIRVALLSITASGIGLTLTAANVVLFAELYWNPGALRQCEDRAHRIGQTRSVRVIYPVASQTIDHFIWPLIQKKLRIIERVLLTK